MHRPVTVYLRETYIVHYVSKNSSSLFVNSTDKL